MKFYNLYVCIFSMECWTCRQGQTFEENQRIHSRQQVWENQSKFSCATHYLNGGESKDRRKILCKKSKWILAKSFAKIQIDSRRMLQTSTPGRSAHAWYAFLRVQKKPLDNLNPFRYTLKLTNGSNQNLMDPLNFTRHGMSKSFVELLAPNIVIVNTKRLNKLWHRKPRNLLQVGNIQNFSFSSLDPLGPEKFSWAPWILESALPLQHATCIAMMY